MISKLHDAARYFVSTLPEHEYAMGHDAWNAMMKERALHTILPELLQVTHDHKQHLARQSGEAAWASSPVLGKLYAYQELQKPKRKKAEVRDKKKVRRLMAVNNLLNTYPEPTSNSHCPEKDFKCNKFGVGS